MESRFGIFVRFFIVVKKILCNSWINILLFFVPAGIAVNQAAVHSGLIFTMNAIAIIPLACLLSFATESLAHELGATWGALLNVSFGNVVELIILLAI